jgi:hypothetical protein
MKTSIVITRKRINNDEIIGNLQSIGYVDRISDNRITFQQEDRFFVIDSDGGVFDDFDLDEKQKILNLIENPFFYSIDFRNIDSLQIAMNLFSEDSFIWDEEGFWCRIDDAKRNILIV